MTQNLPEPWLRGPIAGVHPAVMPVVFTFTQVREELAKQTAGLTQEEIWMKPANAVAPLGFHLKHMAGTVDRLMTYLAGNQFSHAQLNTLKDESETGDSLDTLLRLLNDSFDSAEEQLRKIDPESLYAPRAVGRRKLPATVFGLLVHICEHTQRHLGQAVTTIKLIQSHRFLTAKS